MNTKFLDGLRGIAALYVMIGHARWLLWEGFAEGYLKHPEQYSLTDRFLMYFFSLFKFGHEFVLLFFVLSGFVIHIGFSKKLNRDINYKFDFIEYFFKRVKRIYPPFLLALLLTALLDLAGKKIGFSIYSGTTPYSLINENIANKDYYLTTLLGNIFFLYKEYVPIFGTNGPTWSLKYEWWFYMVYPFFLLISRKNIYYSTILIILLFIASFYPPIWPEMLLKNIFNSMICWWLGVILAEIYTSRLKLSILIFSMIAGFLFIALLVLEANNINISEDLGTSFLFTSLIGFLLYANAKNINLSWLEKMKPIGDFSYSLYILHFPILVFMSGWIMSINYNSLPHHSYFVILGIIVTIIFSYIAHLVVEVPFIKLNQKKSTPNE